MHVCVCVVPDPPERPRGHNQMDDADLSENFQLWSFSGESCPEGTIPIRRTTEEDMLRANSVRRFGRKKVINRVRRDTSGNGHEVCRNLRAIIESNTKSDILFSFFSQTK